MRPSPEGQAGRRILGNMIGLLRKSMFAAWLAFGWPYDLPAGAEAPDPVITDTADYCTELRLLVDDMVREAVPPPRAEVEFLSEEGRFMCEHGLIRGGITRLRRALMMLREAQDVPGG